MKKMTAMVLALGLTVPAQAWTLFPVREKVVIETKTDYTATIITGVVAVLASLAVGKLIFSPKKLSDIEKNAIVEKFMTRLAPVLSSHYRIVLDIDYANIENSKVHLYRNFNRTDLNDVRREDYNDGFKNGFKSCVDRFNDQFSALGLSIQSNGQRFIVTIGSTIHDMKVDLTPSELSYIVNLIERGFFEYVQQQQEEAASSRQEGVE
jgi:hypothetical protein